MMRAIWEFFCIIAFVVGAATIFMWIGAFVAVFAHHAGLLPANLVFVTAFILSLVPCLAICRLRWPS